MDTDKESLIGGNMKFKNPLLVVANIEQSKKFYWEVLGLRTISDLGVHVVLTGGLALQTENSWREFSGKEIQYQGNDIELYFEEDDFDTFINKLQTIKTIEYIHPVIEHAWGQRVIRFYDPDHHIIEVGENMKNVCKRYLDKGMSIEEITEKIGIPLKAIKAYTR